MRFFAIRYASVRRPHVSALMTLPPFSSIILVAVSASASTCDWAHYAHLLVHGTLHAQGYDHETGERDALEMETLEILLLSALGFDNPY